MGPQLGRCSSIICVGHHSIISALVLVYYLVLQIFLSTSKCLKTTVWAQFFPLSLSVPETAMGVTLNAQQHSDSEYVQAIHRWEMGVCWGEYCVPLLAISIYWQGMRNPSAARAAGNEWWELGACWSEYFVLLLAGCSLNCCSWPCAYMITLWETAVWKIMAERGRLFCHVESWELIVPQLTAFWYENIYSFLYFYNSNKYSYVTNNKVTW